MAFPPTKTTCFTGTSTDPLGFPSFLIGADGRPPPRRYPRWRRPWKPLGLRWRQTKAKWRRPLRLRGGRSWMVLLFITKKKITENSRSIWKICKLTIMKDSQATLIASPLRKSLLSKGFSKKILGDDWRQNLQGRRWLWLHFGCWRRLQAGFFIHFGLWVSRCFKHTLQGINISPKNGHIWRWFSFSPGWDMLVSWKLF